MGSDVSSLIFKPKKDEQERTRNDRSAQHHEVVVYPPLSGSLRSYKDQMLGQHPIITRATSVPGGWRLPIGIEGTMVSIAQLTIICYYLSGCFCGACKTHLFSVRTDFVTVIANCLDEVWKCID